MPALGRLNALILLYSFKIDHSLKMDAKELRLVRYLLGSLPFCDQEEEFCINKAALKAFKFGDTVEITSFCQCQSSGTLDHTHWIKKNNLHAKSKELTVTYLRTDGKPTSTTLYNLAKVKVDRLLKNHYGKKMFF